MHAETKIAVIGAGIAGLSAAYDLQRAGFDVTVLEKDDCVGGRIKTIKRGEFVFDVGAFIYLGSYGESADLIKELGLESQLGRFDAFGAMPRNGVLNFLDFSKPIKTIMTTGYLTFGSKLKLIKLLAFLFRNWKHLNYHDAAGIAAIDDDTVKSYCDREMNQEIYDYVASVVVRGPWLSNPATTSIGQLLWTMKNFFKPYFYGLDDGMDSLPRALAAQLNVAFNCEVTAITESEGGITVNYAKDGISVSNRFEGCIIATPVEPALAMYAKMNAAQRRFYGRTTYISAVDAHLVLRNRPSNPATYIMVSPRENPHLCGVIVDHLKAANRVPPSMGMLTVFCSDEWSKAHMHASDESILREVLGFIEPYYGDLRGEVVDYEIGRWPVVVPKMNQGRFREILLYEQSIDPSSRVQLAGDLDPIGGVNAALVSGKKAAARIASQYR